MTAEVAVLNRSAVALAADSAVTLSGLDARSDVDKIFQNENKLFELSKHHPIGVMLYNSTTFFEIPWELIIKDFRNEIGEKSFEHVYSWAEHFRIYVSQHPIFKPHIDRQKEFVESIFLAEFDAVIVNWNARSRRLFFEKQTKAVVSRYSELMKLVLNRRIEWFASAPHYDGFDESEADALLKLYEAEFLSAKHKCLGQLPLDHEHHNLLATLAKQVLARARPSWFSTGLVFAGYGNKELFPSLSCIEIGGTLGDRLRWVQKRQADIDRSASTAEIIPFAQRETVDTLLFGRADRYERQISKYLTDTLSQVGGELVKQMTKAGKQRQVHETHLKNAIKGVIKQFREKHAQEFKDAFANDTLEIVRHMPKPDLAAFAESLVTVSSMMRRVTVGPETVGGPVDVAVVSRHEGFIWVKRKHYFVPDLNQRYMSRAFSVSKGV